MRGKGREFLMSDKRTKSFERKLSLQAYSKETELIEQRKRTKKENIKELV